MREAQDQSRDLAKEILGYDGQPDMVVGPANGALLPAKIVADFLRAPLEIVHIRRKGSRYKQIFFSVKAALHIPNFVLTLPPLMPLWRYLQERYSGLEQSGNAFNFDVRGKYVVIVDDAIHTGRSARYIKEQLLRQGAMKVRIAVLCWYKGIGDSGDWAPDIYLHRQDQYYPWSNNSPHLQEFMAWLPANGLKFWR
jgi:hypoxanthine phosphoribosyltransferase